MIEAGVEQRKEDAQKSVMGEGMTGEDVLRKRKKGEADDIDRLSTHLSIWWKRQRSQAGLLRALFSLGKIFWEFAVDSLPQRRRQRYGDAEYDWDYRVNTTSATVGWRDRLLGLLHSPYQPTEPALFHEILETLFHDGGIDPREFVFLDLGSGKGRTLLMASDYPFSEVIGVELLPSLHRAAQENIAAYKSEKQRCFVLQSISADASGFEFPSRPMVLYLFNPLPEDALVRTLKNLEASLEKNLRKCFVIYHNPLLESHLRGQTWLEKLSGTSQFAIYRFAQGHGSRPPHQSSSRS